MSKFDFGPISRTVDASTGKGEGLNFASLPIHEAMAALLTATNRDEFVGWLWHDLFKALFYWPVRTKWDHLPDKPCLPSKVRETKLSKVVQIPVGLVATHHPGAYRKCKHLLSQLPKFNYLEPSTLTNEFEQTRLGTQARFLQLTFLSEPAMNTALLRAVIADAFMEVVTKRVAEAIESLLRTKSLAFKRVRYVFNFKRIQVPQPPSDQALDPLKDLYEMRVVNDELIISHLTPVASKEMDGRHIEVTIDFTAAPPTPGQFKQNVISLIELLTVYQDSRTILMGIPQFLRMTEADLTQLKQKVKDKTEQALRILDIVTLAEEKKIKKQAKPIEPVDWSALPLKKQGDLVDLLAHVFDEQVEIRLVGGEGAQGSKSSGKEERPLHAIISRAYELMEGKSRRCRYCNTAFESAFPPAEAWVSGSFSGDFTDFEHVGFKGDICPMCRIYALNSKVYTSAEKAWGKTGARKAYRGAFALLTPSSHFAYSEGHILLEHPPLDVGGRFKTSLQRATVTLQEFALFNSLSRRIIGEIWKRLSGRDDRPLPLPYLGGILLTEREAAQIRRLFNHFEVLFKEVVLWAYPFKIPLHPAVEIAFEMSINDRKQHLTKHTYLKTSPVIVSVHPKSKFNLLVDNGIQLEVNRELFEAKKWLEKLLEEIKDPKRRRSWILAMLQGEDPVTAMADAFDDQGTLWQAEKLFWDRFMAGDTPSEQWENYERILERLGRTFAKYPMLIEFFIKPR